VQCFLKASLPREAQEDLMADSKKSSVPPIMRLVHPQAFADFALRTGVPTDRLFRSVGLPVYCDDPSAFVPLRKAWALFDAAAKAVDPFVGWHVGGAYGDGLLSADLLKRIEHAPTLYRALHLVVRLITAESSHLRLGIAERRDDIVFFTGYSTIKDWPGYAGSQAYQLEVYVDIIRQYLGRDWVPEEMGIEQPVVPAVAKEHFPGARILPNQPVGYVTVPRSCLHLPPRRGAAGQSDRGKLFLPRDLDFVTTLQTLLEPLLLEGYPSRQLAASLVGTSVRTLARRLRESGTSYRILIDELRLGVAKRHLTDSDLQVIDASSAVGFRDPANFNRMFRRLAGLTPRHFRQVALDTRRGERTTQSARRPRRTR